MGWIRDLFGGKKPTPTPTPNQGKPAGGGQQPPATAPDPKDTVTISGGQEQPPVGKDGSKPNGNTPGGLPGATGQGQQTAEEKAAAAEAAKQEQALKERLQIIETVGRGVSGDFHLGLEAGEAWAYDFGENKIIYRKDDLKGKSEDYAIGVILQETGRRLYSRTPSAPEFKDNPAIEFLHNTVEGPRVDNLQISRFAGAKQFFQKVYDEDLFQKTEESIREDLQKALVKQGISEEDAKKAVMKMKSPVPRHMQYALGLLYDWHTDGQAQPDWLRDKNAIRALEGTKADYHEAYKLQRDIFEKDLSPKEIIEQARKAEQITVEKLWPVYKKLLEMDEKDLGQSLFGNGGAQGAGQGQGQGKNQQSGKGQGQGQSQQSGQSQQGGQGQGQGQAKDKAPEGGQGSGQSNGQQNQQPQNGQSNQSQGGGQGQQNQQNQPQQGQGQGGGGGKADQSQDKQGQGGGGGGEKSEENKDKQGQGGGGGEKSEEQKDKQGQGGGGGEKSEEQKDKQGQGGGGQGQQAPDPKDIDTSDGGTLNNDNLSDKQKEIIRQALRELQKEANSKVESKADRDAKAGRSNGSGNKGGNQGGENSAQGGGDGRNTSQIDLPTLQELLRQKAETEQKVDGMKSPYEKYYTQLAPQTDEFSGELKNILEENAEMKYMGDFKSGPKLNMRRAMQSAAKYERTGVYDQEIWLRRQDPSKRDYDFIFVLDESGSMMDSDKWDNLIKGLVMAAEGLEQLKIKFAVVGFSDSPVIHKTFEDKYDVPFREQMLNGIQRANHGGTNDSDALDTAMEMMREKPSDHEKFILVITDGQGKEAELRQGIAQARRDGVKVIGVGIGEGMAYVKKVYPDYVVPDNIKNLPYELSDRIRDEILGTLD